MLAMLFDGGDNRLRAGSVERTPLLPHELRIEVDACAVCRTDLHIVDGDLAKPKLPLVPGHEIVGRVIERGSAAFRFMIGDRLGIPWLGWTCGSCPFCTSGRENLCDSARFTGYDIDGGFATETVADERFCFSLPEAFDAEQAAPLLCAGLIGFRSFRAAGEARRLGLYGFGAAAHIVAQIASAEGREVFAFTRGGDTEGQRFARSLGARWSGGSDESPPEELDAAIIFAPVGALVPQALKSVGKGGTVVCAGIHMSDIPTFPYEILWGERAVRSVANLTRKDGEAFFEMISKMVLKTQTTTFALSDANRALDAVRSGSVKGAAVLVP